jgi:hypothetical protein
MKPTKHGKLQTRILNNTIRDETDHLQTTSQAGVCQYGIAYTRTSTAKHYPPSTRSELKAPVTFRKRTVDDTNT